MKSPAKELTKIAKELKVDISKLSTPRQRIAFLEKQLSDLKGMVWRSLVDCLHSARLIESDTEAIRNKGLENMTQHKNEVRQFYGAVLMIQSLIETLREEYSLTEDFSEVTE